MRAAEGADTIGGRKVPAERNGDLKVSEDEPKVARRPSGRGLLPGLRPRPPLSSTGLDNRKQAGGSAVPFVLGVYAASRLFYLLAGALFAGLLPAVGFYRLTPDVPLGRLNIRAHWDGV